MQAIVHRFHSENVLFERITAFDGKTLFGQDPLHTVDVRKLDAAIVEPVVNATQHHWIIENQTKQFGRYTPLVKSGLVHMSPGEIGCIYSHTHLWKKIVENQNDNTYHLTCIFEDDALLVPSFKERQQQILSELPVDNPIDL
jgi:GR25 family glycosyltransferase involved in LPS biosynthesis